ETSWASSSPSGCLLTVRKTELTFGDAAAARRHHLYDGRLGGAAASEMTSRVEEHYEMGLARGERAEGSSAATPAAPGRLARYLDLFRRSVHFRFTIANLISGVLPNFVSGAIRG